MSEKFGISEPDPRRRPCVSIDFGASLHENEYLLILMPQGIYGEAVTIPTDWEGVFRKRLGGEWYVMTRGSRLEIKPPVIGEGIDARPTRTDETDRMVAEVLKSVIDEKFELRFSSSKKY